MKNPQRKILAVILAALMLVSSVCPAYAANYRTMVSKVLTTWEEQDALCQTAEEQKVNGLYRSAELLSILCSEWDDGAFSKNIATVSDTFIDEDEQANTLLKKQVNGAYRCVEYMYILSCELDVRGAWKKTINAIWKEFTDGEATARSRKGKVASAMQCQAEYAYVIACLMDPDGSFGKDIDQVWDAFLESGTPSSLNEQIITSSHATVELLYLVNRMLDTGNRYRSRSATIMEGFDAMNQSETGSDALIINGLYRMVELLGVIGHECASR